MTVMRFRRDDEDRVRLTATITLITATTLILGMVAFYISQGAP